MPSCRGKGPSLQYNPTLPLQCITYWAHAQVSTNQMLWTIKLIPHPIILPRARMLCFPWTLLRTNFRLCLSERVIMR